MHARKMYFLIYWWAAMYPPSKKKNQIITNLDICVSNFVVKIYIFLEQSIVSIKGVAR